MELDVAVQLKHSAWKRVLRPYCKTTRALCEAALAETPLAKTSRRYEIAVVLADDAFIRELNRDYRCVDKATNVLSFPGMEPWDARQLKGLDEFYIGDVVLAYETLEREALAQQKPLREHAAHLLTHGVLHLLGYDHDEETAAARMEKLEIKILKKQGIDNPYL